LAMPVIRFDAAAVRGVAGAFADVIESERYTCWAAAVMPDHVHILIRKHRHTAETMLANLKALSRERLRDAGHVPADHPAWTAGHGWKVFLEHPDDVERTCRYIHRNAVQHWPFIQTYNRWPLHEGHSPNSPYAKALKAAGRYP
jgi:REP element-mobilizing transposase RayT